MHYYNEFEPYCAQWLRNLIKAGLIPQGDVDERDLRTIQARDLEGYTACHFFAGLGGWPYALRLAGWPDERRVWTGSCPCQPYSDAGQRKGDADERNLWPVWFPLIRERRPATVFGEQVAAAIRHGWLDGICADLEGEDYACGAVVLGAHSAGAPHIRQRLWWVGHTERSGREGQQRRRAGDELAHAGEPRGLEHSEGQQVGLSRQPRQPRSAGGGLGESAEGRRGPGRASPAVSGQEARGTAERSGPAGGLEHAHEQRWAGQGLHLRSRPEGQPEVEQQGLGFWDAFDLILCADGKSRRVEPGTSPLADGVPARVGQLRAYGNAINPYVAAEFIRAFMETSGGK